MEGKLDQLVSVGVSYFFSCDCLEVCEGAEMRGHVGRKNALDNHCPGYFEVFWR